MTSAELLLGKNIGYLIDDQKRMSRAAFASQVGVSVAAIGQLIRGDSKGLRPLTLVKAARALDCTIEELVCEDLRARAALRLAEPATSPYALSHQLNVPPVALARRAGDLLVAHAMRGEPRVIALARAIIAFLS